MEKTRSMAVSTASLSALLLCFFILTTSLDVTIAVTNPSDVSALNKLAKAWSSTTFLNWVGDPCDDSWTGIDCDFANTSVTSLFLENKNLYGSLHSAVGGLTQLRQLELSRNPNLGGEVPQELGDLINLSYLSLQWCNFSGTIPPALGNLIHVTFFGLNGNRLTGPIPFSFGNLVNVSWLDLSANQLSGPIPVSSSPGSGGIGLDNLTTVRHFHFNDNQLSGSIPPGIFTPRNLLHVIVDHNKLVNGLPREVGNAQTLTILRVDNNELSGNLPVELGTMRNLTTVHLENNTFSGSLPDLSNLTNLQLLDVSGNTLFDRQSLPGWLLNSSRLQTLSLAQSNFGGEISSGIFRLPNLQSLNLSLNQFNDTLDFQGITGDALKVIDVRNNNISGFNNQPTSNHPLVQLLLEGNPLCSSTFLVVKSSGCGSSSVLNAWSPTANSSCLGVKCHSGRYLNPKTCGCSFPYQLQLQLTSQQFLNLTTNLTQKIEGELATGLGLDPRQVVIASGSLLVDTRYALNLQFFSLTSDSLPSRDTSNITNSLNQRRFSIPEGPFQVPMSQGLATYQKKKSSTIGAGAIAGIILGVAVVAFLLAMFALRQKRLADKAAKASQNHPFASWGAGGGEVGDAPRLKGSRWVSLAELKLATDDWSERNEVGEGGYGKVYKGILTTGDLVAIKRAREGSRREAAEFKNEIETLSRVHHRNLVGLVGFCFEGGEQALVFQFETTATLRDHLQGTTESPLSWQDRLGIAIGAARALAYLHDHANPPIVHGDVKSANVLLSERQVAKVSDFNLSRLMGRNMLEETGYLDPEYYKTSQLTSMSDVYSFGVILFELLTAEDPVVNGRFIVHDFRQAMDKGGWEELRPLLDPRLNSVSNKELEAFLRIAFTCVEETSANRQDMASVVKHLEALGGSYPNSGVENLEDFDNSVDNVDQEMHDKGVENLEVKNGDPDMHDKINDNDAPLKSKQKQPKDDTFN